MKYPETKQGASGRRGSGKGERVSKNVIVTFSEDVAVKTGKSRSVVERKARIGKKLRSKDRMVIIGLASSGGGRGKRAEEFGGPAQVIAVGAPNRASNHTARCCGADAHLPK